METNAKSSYETTPETQPGVWTVGSKGGLYTGLILMIFSLILFLFEVPADGMGSTIFTTISFVVGVFLTHRAFKVQGNGYMSYGQGLGLGAIIGLVSGALSGVFLSLYTFFIDDMMIQNQLNQARIELENQGMADAQIEQAMAISEMITSPVGLFFATIINYLFYAFIIALIISAFTKKRDPQLEY